MNLYLLYFLGLQAPKYCSTCKSFKTHFPSTKDYITCPLFPSTIKKQEIDYKYCFRNCNCELYFRDSLFLIMK